MEYIYAWESEAGRRIGTTPSPDEGITESEEGANISKILETNESQSTD